MSRSQQQVRRMMEVLVKFTRCIRTCFWMIWRKN